VTFNDIKRRNGRFVALLLKSALILSAFENRLTAMHHETSPAAEQNKNTPNPFSF